MTSLCTAYNFGLLPVIIFIALTFVYYCLLLICSQLLIWIGSILILGIWSYNDSLFVSS